MSNEESGIKYPFQTEYHRSLFGRKQIFTNEKVVTRNNIVKVLQECFIAHERNRAEIEYLYNYFKGNQPSLYREKTIRDDITNRFIENRASEIVNFKVGYLCGNPIQYVSRNTQKDIAEQVDLLNAYMQSEGKASKDKDLIEWQMICGTSYRMVLADAYPEIDSAPFEIYTLDPRNTFVIYSNDYRKKPLAAVYYSNEEMLGGTEVQTTKHISVYTDTEYFELTDSKLEVVKPHAYGMIPIFEYPANNSRIGAFELVLGLLDAVNDLDCNRMDGVEQFVQSLMVIYNAEVDDSVTSTDIQKRGLVVLKSIGEAKADIKILSEELDQTQTQTLKLDLLSAIREIAGIPAQGDGNSSDSSNNGAIVLKNGWQSAETHAKSSELMIKLSEQKFLKLVLRICKELSPIDLLESDIEPHFTRNNYDNILSKSQTLTTLLATEKVAPSIAFRVCGLFVDPEEAWTLSQKYIEDLKATQKEMLSVIDTEDSQNEEGMNDGESASDRQAEQPTN